MNELLSCPFCGGEAHTRTNTVFDKNFKWTVECELEGCMAFSGCSFYRTEAEAIDAWNTRAVESANGLVYIPSFRDNGEFPEHIWASLGGETAAYFRERTCHIVKSSRKYVMSDGTELFEDGCSECNGYLDPGDIYCSQCGAKVVKE